MGRSEQKIIVPLDVAGRGEAIALVKLLPEVSFWKVGLELFITDGAYILPYLKEQGKQIFLDLKLHDIPNTMAGACRSVLKYQVDLLTLHSLAGRDALQASQRALQGTSNPPKLLGVTVLTSLTKEDLRDDLAVSLELTEYVLSLAVLSQTSGLDGAICSPLEVAKLRSVCGNDFLFVCPGIRPSWSELGDQKRTMTPLEALQRGANYLVIGRPVTAAADPVAAWHQLIEELGTTQ